MSKKKLIRKNFREAVFQRDGYCCRICGKPGQDRQDATTIHENINLVFLDAHHISPRDQMPNGGYVAENGISLCDACHILAEEAVSGFSSDELFIIIGSSLEIAIKASALL